MPLVKKEVARMLRRVPPNILRDDLVAAGTYGVFDALRKNPERGAAFNWYVRVRIRGALVDELRTQDWLSRRTRAKATAASEGIRENTVVWLDDVPDAQALVDHGAPTPFQLVAGRMARSTLVRAVGHLPPREADIVAWHYFEDVPFKAIAARLGVSEPRVSQLHSRAIGLLRARLAVDPRTAAAA
jgi:RNA polymerase sigma factor for flagellar operon FliA